MLFSCLGFVLFGWLSAVYVVFPAWTLPSQYLKSVCLVDRFVPADLPPRRRGIVLRLSCDRRSFACWKALLAEGRWFYIVFFCLFVLGFNVSLKKIQSYCDGQSVSISWSVYVVTVHTGTEVFLHHGKVGRRDTCMTYNVLIHKTKKQIKSNLAGNWYT